MLKKIFEIFGIAKKGKHTDKTPYIFEQDSIIDDDTFRRDLHLEKKIIEVASNIEDIDKFKLTAAKVASEIGIDKIEKLTQYFHDNPPIPDELRKSATKRGILGGWMIICQSSIFEILYNFREKAISILYDIGFGVYDWTQYQAIDILCRLAEEGIYTEEIIEDIGEHLLNFRYEAIFPSINSLSKIKTNKEVPLIIKEVFHELSKHDVMDGYHVLKILATNYPESVKDELSFLKSIANGEALKGRNLALDEIELKINDKEERQYVRHGKEIKGDIYESYKINAALLFYQLDSNDSEIFVLLQNWKTKSTNEKFIEAIKLVLKEI